MKQKRDLKPALPYAILLLIFLIVPLFLTGSFWFSIFIVVFAKMIPTTGLRIVSLSGDMSFAMGAFMGVGAYMSAMLTKTVGLPIWVGVIAAGVIAALVGVLTGIPFARLKTVYYCMATMFLGVFLIYVFQSFQLFGGYTGIKKVQKLFTDNYANYYFFLGLAVVCIFLMWRFEHSRIGNTLKAIAQSHDVAASIGVNEKFYRLLAIGVACFFSGIAGACYAHYNTQVVPNIFGMTLDLWIIMFMMLGGKDSFFGPIIGTTVLGLINETSRAFGSYAPFIACAALIVVAYVLPGGLASIPEVIRKHRDKKKFNTGPGGPSISDAAKTGV